MCADQTRTRTHLPPVLSTTLLFIYVCEFFNSFSLSYTRGSHHLIASVVVVSFEGRSEALPPEWLCADHLIKVLQRQ